MILFVHIWQNRCYTEHRQGSLEYRSGCRWLQGDSRNCETFFLLLKSYFSNTVYTCKTKFWHTFVLRIFFNWCIENEVIKENVIFDQFWIDYKSYNFEARTIFFIVFRISYSTNVMKYILRFWGYFLGVYIFFEIHIYFQMSTHISHNIPELQNLIHYICRVRDSERNKINLIVLASKLCDS